jgi:hypothetical protein
MAGRETLGIGGGGLTAAKATEGLWHPTGEMDLR